MSRLASPVPQGPEEGEKPELVQDRHGRLGQQLSRLSPWVRDQEAITAMSAEAV